MKAVGPLFYFAVIAAAIGGPAYAVSSKSSNNTITATSKTESSTSKRQLAREEVKPDPNRRPVWIMPTKEYKMAPPATAPRIADSFKSGQDKPVKQVAKKDVEPRRASVPTSRVSLSYVEEAAPKTQFGFNGWRN